MSKQYIDLHEIVSIEFNRLEETLDHYSDHYSISFTLADGIIFHKRIERTVLRKLHHDVNELFEWKALDPQTCADAAAKNPFQIGDRVRLRSETRWMTVLCACCCAPECGWFEGDRHHCEAFPTAALTKEDPEDDIPL